MVHDRYLAEVCVPYFKNELNDIVTIKVWMDTHFSVYVCVCVYVVYVCPCSYPDYGN